MKKKFSCPNCLRRFSHQASLEYHLKKGGCEKKVAKKKKKRRMIEGSITESDVEHWS